MTISSLSFKESIDGANSNCINNDFDAKIENVSMASIENMGVISTPEQVEDLKSNLFLQRSRAKYDKALKNLPEEQRHFLFLDRKKWNTVNPPKVDPFLFDKGSEPGYRDGMQGGLNYIRDHIGKKMNAEELCTLHDICVDGVSAYSGCLKKGSGPLKKGYAPGYLYQTGKLPANVVAECKEENIIFDPERHDSLKFEFLAVYPGGCIISRFGELDELPIVHDKINQLFDKYYKSIESAQSDDAKLAAIARLCRALQMFHVFPDGNGRTILFALLPKLLIENNFPPVILEDVANFATGYYTVSSMVEQLKQGMQNYHALTQHFAIHPCEKEPHESRERFCTLS